MILQKTLQDIKFNNAREKYKVVLLKIYIWTLICIDTVNIKNRFLFTK